MAKKIRIKKRNVGIVVGIIVVLVVAIIGIIKWKQKLDYQATDEYKLLTIGYSEEDTNFLIENLKEKDLDKIIENKTLNENIINLFKQEYFLYKHLDSYLEYADENPDKQLSEVIALINVNANKEWYDGIKDTDTTKDSLILVNKFHSLASDFEPNNLVSIKDWYAYPNAKEMDEDAYYAFISMYNAAKEENINLAINYSYRAYQEQEEIYDYYNKQYGTNYISVMPCNLYGINDNFSLENSHVLPALIRKFHEAKIKGEPSVIIWGSGKPLREFLNVDDLADACLFLMDHYEGDDFFNVGYGEEVTIMELALLIKKVVGFEGELIMDASKPDGTMRKLTDISRIKALGWEPKITLEAGVEETYQWFRDKYESGDFVVR